MLQKLERKIKIKKFNDLDFYHRVPSTDMGMFNECKANYTQELFPDDIFLDLGANCGSNIILYSNKVKKLIAYEPVKDSYDLINLNIERNNIKNVEVYNKAVSLADGNYEFFFSENSISGFASGSINKVKGRDTISIESDNFESVMLKHRPTVLKMDIEGAEWDILFNSDLNELLKSVRVFYLETHFDRRYNINDENIILSRLSNSFDIIERNNKIQWRIHKCTDITLKRR